MFKKSEKAKRDEKIHKLLSHGWRYAVIRNGEVVKTYRYAYEHRTSEPLVELKSLLNEKK